MVGSLVWPLRTWVYLSIFLTIHDGIFLRSVAGEDGKTGVLVNMTNISNSSSSDTIDNGHLNQIKIGLAAAFFFGVLLACGVPILIIDCLQKNDQIEARRSPPVLGTKELLHSCTDRYDGEKNLSYDSRKNGDLRQTNDRSSWSATEVNQPAPSLPESPLSPQSPGCFNTETTDLLTGKPVSTMNTWTHPRRVPDRLSLKDSSASTEIRRMKSSSDNRTWLKPVPKTRSTSRHKKMLQLWFSRCNCFAAGIFLSSGFMELYVDVEEVIEEAKMQLKITSDFPFAPFLTLIGLFLVLTIEQVVWTVKMSSDKRPTEDGREALISHSPSSSNSSPSRSASQDEAAAAPTTSNTQFSFCLESNSPQVISHCSQDRVNASRTKSAVTPVPLIEGHCNESPPHAHSHLPSADNLASFGSLIRVLLLVCAMSVHSLFEGLAVGLQPTTQRTLTLFSAILLHKLIIAAGIGLNLATSMSASKTSTDATVDADRSSTKIGVDKKILLYQSISTLIFASASPLGVVIGCALMRQQQSGVLQMTTAVLQGLACGTFFYVVFCELLPEEFRTGLGDRLGKLSFLILGFLLVSLYSFLMPH
ncbi:unnamed protein product [Calicophoron daubneyi]|uniref:Uncharacterized protein n=1 Tax=Calicophoron daubneyi TaxID=300641 RepID=A0AAV2U0A9_CALDB